MRRQALAVMGLVGVTALACGTTVNAGSGPSGERLFQASGCAACHVDGMGVMAPGLDGLYGSEVLLESGEFVVADEAYLRESILEPGRSVVSGYPAVMPEFAGQLSDEEIETLVEFIKSLED